MNYSYITPAKLISKIKLNTEFFLRSYRRGQPGAKSFLLSNIAQCGTSNTERGVGQLKTSYNHLRQQGISWKYIITTLILKMHKSLLMSTKWQVNNETLKLDTLVRAEELTVSRLVGNLPRRMHLCKCHQRNI